MTSSCFDKLSMRSGVGGAPADLFFCLRLILSLSKERRGALVTSIGKIAIGA